MSLFSSLVEVWHKRGAPGIENLNTMKIDGELLERYFAEFGGERFSGSPARADGIGYAVTGVETGASVENPIDDFWRVRDSSVPKRTSWSSSPTTFYFGCEADDPSVTPSRFDHQDRCTFGARILTPIYSSDIGHWDVPDMRGVLPEAYEMVEDELVTLDDFRDFVFTNPVTLHAGMNPDFFKGTVVEQEAAALLANGGAREVA